MNRDVEQLAKQFAEALQEKAEMGGDFFVDHGKGMVAFDGTIDLAALAEIAIAREKNDGTD